MWKIPENVTKLVELWKAGNSAKVIGGILGCSRNSIIGKIHRLGLGSIERANLSPQARKDHSKAKVSKVALVKPVKLVKALPDSLTDTLAMPQKPTGKGVSILKAKRRHCRDVIDPTGSLEGLALFCGEPVVHDGPWCEYHHYRNTQRQVR